MKTEPVDDAAHLAAARADMADEPLGSVEDLLRTAVDTALTALGQQPLAPTIQPKGLARLPLRILAAFRRYDRARRAPFEALAAQLEERAKYATDLDPYMEHSSETYARAAERREVLEDVVRELRKLLAK